MFRRTHQLKLLPLLAAATVVLTIASVAEPFTHRNLPGGHDATAHITYTYLFDRALRQGQLPVRWVEWVQNGDGQPLFNFYYPGLYYLVSIVRAVTPSLAVALKVTMVLLWWTGAVFVYAFLKRWGRLPALLGAALFALSPYVILDAFVRAAYAEFAVIALAPGLFWACDRLLRLGRPGDALAVSAITGLMLITHLPGVVIFAPVCAAYVIYLLATSQTTWRHLGTLALSVGLGVALAAFYIVPALTELPLVTANKMTTGYFDYQRHFVYPVQWVQRRWGFGASVEGPDDAMSFELGVVQIGVLAAALGWAGAALAKRASRPAGDILFWLAVVGVALFVMTEASNFLWRVTPPLSYLQFPWRCLMLMPFACAVLAARLLTLVRSRAVQAVIVMALVGVQYLAYRDHLGPATWIPRAAMNIDDPQWADTHQAGIHAFIDRGFTPAVARQESAAHIGRWSAEGEGQIREVSLSDTAIALDLESAHGLRVTVHTPYFPGWRAWVDGRESGIAPVEPEGFPVVEVPAGAHRLEVRFTNTRLRATANAISASAALVFVVFLAVPGRRPSVACQPRGVAAVSARRPASENSVM